MDYLDLLPKADSESIINIRESFKQRLKQQKKGFLRFTEPLSRLKTLPCARFHEYSQNWVQIGKKEELNPEQHALLKESMRAFMPWRKGPFNLFGLEIDAEWKSYLKWQRLSPALPELKGKLVADVGCNNGYYMFKLLEKEPLAVVGLEPVLQHYCCALALKQLAGAERLFFDPLGVEHLGLFPQSFDLVLLMGVIYHRSDPIGVLKELHGSLKPDGTVIIESQVIPGADEMALFPRKTYAKAPGVYFVPSSKCLENWLARAGFIEIELIAQSRMSEEEQRATEWMTFESYRDFIDPADPGKTIEGYPAPERAIIKARKKS